MTIELQTCATVSITFSDDCHSWEAPFDFHSINDALAYAENEIDVRLQALHASIWDTQTGELYVTCSAEGAEDPEEENDFSDWDYNEDMGFDPYMGCYTDDC